MSMNEDLVNSAQNQAITQALEIIERNDNLSNQLDDIEDSIIQNEERITEIKKNLDNTEEEAQNIKIISKNATETLLESIAEEQETLNSIITNQETKLKQLEDKMENIDQSLEKWKETIQNFSTDQKEVLNQTINETKINITSIIDDAKSKITAMRNEIIEEFNKLRKQYESVVQDQQNNIDTINKDRETLLQQYKEEHIQRMNNISKESTDRASVLLNMEKKMNEGLRIAFIEMQQTIQEFHKDLEAILHQKEKDLDNKINYFVGEHYKNVKALKFEEISKTTNNIIKVLTIVILGLIIIVLWRCI